MKKILSLILSALICSAMLLPGLCFAEGTDNAAKDSETAAQSETEPSNSSDETEPPLSDTDTAGDVLIYANAAIVADLDTGKVLYNKNPHEKLYPASLTKIMTALIALDNSSLDEKLTVSENAVNSMEKGVMRMGVVAGQELTMEEALHALLINSANDIAIAIAEHISGSVEEFTKLMNEYAKNLGCTQTHFSNPTGLDADDLSTSALDIAVICKKAAQNADFIEICGAKSYTVQSKIINSGGKENEDAYVLTNQHKMLSGEFPYEYAYAGKTGYTNAGRITLATYAKKDNMNLVSVILDCPQENDDAYEDTQSLLNYCFDNFESLSANAELTLNLTEQNSLLSGGSSAQTDETKPAEQTVSPSDESSEPDSFLNIIKGHSWQDYALAAAIILAAVILLILIIRQMIIYLKRRRRRKNYERLKKQRLEEEQSHKEHKDEE